MPTVECVDGVRIVIHNGERSPSHIHAICGKFEVLIEIEPGKVYAGDLPTKQYKESI